MNINMYIALSVYDCSPITCDNGKAQSWGTKRTDWIATLLVSKSLMSSIENTFQPYVHSGTSRPIISPQRQTCSPSLERYQFSRVLDDADWV